MARPAISSIEVPTRDRLLDAAEIEFGKSGFLGARLSDIAARAGIRRSSLLYHFKSKQMLFAAMTDRNFSELGAALMVAMQSAGDFEQRLVHVVTCLEQFLAARPSMASSMLRDMLDGHGPGNEILLKQVVPLLGLVEQFIRQESRESLGADFPYREALMSTAGNILLRAAAGELRTALWGERDNSLRLMRALFATGSNREITDANTD